MSGQHHISESECPTCGNDAAIVRVRGNALSAVCTQCRRVDVAPLLSSADLLTTEGETFEAELFELEAVRSGQASPLSLAVELRMPVPTR
jgi:hypothetical protein